MTRFRIGVVLLAALLGLSLWAQTGMEQIHRPIAQEMLQAAYAARSGHWSQAGAHVAAAEEQWFRRHSLTAALADHQPMEDIESLMAQLPACAAERDSETYSALCSELARRILAMSEAHSMGWETVL